MTRAWTAALVVAVLVCALVAWAVRDPMAPLRVAMALQGAWVGLSEKRVVIDDHRWAYDEREGKDPAAPTVVMVHGFTGSKENWYPLAARLGGRYRLVIPDLPGWGESQRLSGADYGFSAQAVRLAAFLAHVRRDGSPIVLLGHSMGGGIVAITSAGHPELVARVGLIDAAGVRFADNRFGIEVLAGQNPFAVHDAASLQRYLDTVFHDRGVQPSIPWPASRALIDWRIAQAPFEQQVLDRIGRSDERFLPGEMAARIRQPALLLWCRQDRVIDPSAMALYAARIPQAMQVSLDGCGHMSIMEKPDEVAAAVALLIQRGAPR
ncbi:alpha/beta hydrolase [Pseudoxanthomonas sp. SE1]|uniref:alpha/beta fold hydrolase n=1 Tax=Pseudoxanthomonas sp. SE1 TaxID=1664560 RepID=UPI00240E96FA|nr:alpha/beta hydrolase [Pseudoxanthomonas sp. SE1]WFC42410.1 alpha/beta hydrolase [Pseudoxanthomonas sp. SE1]